MHEVLEAGDSVWREPNINVSYTVSGRWEGAVFVNMRQSSEVNAGRPTTQRRWVDVDTGELVIEQDWGGEKLFTTRLRRREVAGWLAS